MARSSKLRVVVIVVACIIVLMTIFDFLFIGNVRYLVKWQQCSSQPVVVTHPISVGFGASPEKSFIYAKPRIVDPKAPVLLDVGGAKMFCTLDEAKTAASEVSTPSYIEVR